MWHDLKMKNPEPFLTTVIPVYNGERFLRQTLVSLANQVRLPDRVVVLDNCSTDATAALVMEFIRLDWLPLEYRRNETNLGLWGNLNRCLEFFSATDFLHILHADDMITPDFYSEMLPLLDRVLGPDVTPTFGIGWCLDERVDEWGEHLSFSGRASGDIKDLSKDEYLKRKAELGNQAMCATLFRTGRQPCPCRFDDRFKIVADLIFWGEFGSHCETFIHLHSALAKYRWHGENQTCGLVKDVNSIVGDEWLAMWKCQPQAPSLIQRLKLRLLLAVRAQIKAKRLRDMGATDGARMVSEQGRRIVWWPAWAAGWWLMEARELVRYKLLRGLRHPNNIYS